LADAAGPNPGLSGVPGEQGNCTACHGSGASSVNTKGGSVAINFGGRRTYVPGQVQHWIVTVTDASAKRWGFQAAARKSSAVNTPAGGFTATDSNTQVLCSSSNFRSAQLTKTGACSTSLPLMYVEHTLAGTRLGTTGSITFQFDWTPPATATYDPASISDVKLAPFTTPVIAEEAVDRLLSYEEWFSKEVDKGLAADRSEFVEHDDVRRMIESRYPA
jgi:hypothetical protein